MKHFQTKIIRTMSIAVLVCLTALPAYAAPAASSENFTLEQDVFGSAGQFGTSESFGLNDTLGETIVGDSAGTTFKAGQGFWNANDVRYISLSCPATASMNSVVGTGQSSLAGNTAQCIVKTDNTYGYQLSWQASTADLINGDGDHLIAYTPTASGTPETWSVSSTDAEWGAHLGKDSTTVDTGVWGTADTYAGGKWLDVSTSGFTIATRTTQTSSAGDTEIIWFGVEIGASKLQPSGTYSNHIVFTALTL